MIILARFAQDSDLFVKISVGIFEHSDVKILAEQNNEKKKEERENASLEKRILVRAYKLSLGQRLKLYTQYLLMILSQHNCANVFI